MSTKRPRYSEEERELLVINKKLALIQIITEAISGFDTGNWRELVSDKLYTDPKKVKWFLKRIAEASTEKEVEDICWNVMQRSCPDDHLFARIATQQFTFMVHPLNTRSAIGYWIMNMRDTLYARDDNVTPDVVLFARHLYEFMTSERNRSMIGVSSPWKEEIEREYTEFVDSMAEYGSGSGSTKQKMRVLFAIARLAATKKLPLDRFYENGFLTSRKIADEAVFYGASVFERIRSVGGAANTNAGVGVVNSQGSAMRALLSVLSSSSVDPAIVLEEDALRKFLFLETRLSVVRAIVRSGVRRPDPQRHYPFPIHTSDDIKLALLNSEYSTAYHKTTQYARGFDAIAYFTNNRGESTADVFGNSPLQGAIDSGRWKLAELLISNGADPLVPDIETGETAVHRILANPRSLSQIALISAIGRHHDKRITDYRRVNRYGTFLSMAVANFWNDRTLLDSAPNNDALAHALVSAFSGEAAETVIDHLTRSAVTCKDAEGNTKRFQRGMSALGIALSVGFPLGALGHLLEIVDRAPLHTKRKALGPVLVSMIGDLSIGDARLAAQINAMCRAVNPVHWGGGAKQAAVLAVEMHRPLALNALLANRVSSITSSLIVKAARRNLLYVIAAHEIPKGVRVKQAHAAEIQAERSATGHRGRINQQISDLVEDLAAAATATAPVTGRFIPFDKKRLVVVMIERGLQDSVVELIRRGEDLDDRLTGDYRSPLIRIAVRHRCEKVVQAILEREPRAAALASSPPLLNTALENITKAEWPKERDENRAAYQIVEDLLGRGREDPLRGDGEAFETIMQLGDPKLLETVFRFPFIGTLLQRYRSSSGETLLHKTLPYYSEEENGALLFSERFLGNSEFLDAIMRERLLEVRGGGGGSKKTVLELMVARKTPFPVERLKRARLPRRRYSLFDAFSESAVVNAVDWKTLFTGDGAVDDALVKSYLALNFQITTDVLHKSLYPGSHVMTLAAIASAEELAKYDNAGNTALHHLAEFPSAARYLDTGLHPLEWVLRRRDDDNLMQCARRCRDHTQDEASVGDLLVKTLLSEKMADRNYETLRRLVGNEVIRDRTQRLELTAEHGWTDMLTDDKKLLSADNESEMSEFARSLLDKGIVPRWFELTKREAETIGYTLIKHAMRTRNANDVSQYFARNNNKNMILFTIFPHEYKALLGKKRTELVDTLIALVSTPRVTVENAERVTTMARLMRARMGGRR